MTYLVATAFDQFYKTINLSGDFRGVANTRKEWIVKRLRNRFEVLDGFAMGSIPRYTALSGHADLDVLVVLHFGKHIEGKTPEQLLIDVRSALGTGVGSVRRNGQAVTMRFTTWPNVDVVPASVTYTDHTQAKVQHYTIPDSIRGSWLKTRPRAHATAIKNKAGLEGPNFRKVITMVKDWNRRQSVTMQSFHIEVIALKTSADWDDLGWALLQWFKTAQSHLWLCEHLGSDAAEYLNYSQTQAVAEQLRSAEQTALSAWAATYGDNDDHKRAITLWKSLFGQRFPSYG